MLSSGNSGGEQSPIFTSIFNFFNISNYKWFQTVTLLIFLVEQSWLCANSYAIRIWQHLYPNKLTGSIPSQSFVTKLSLEISKYPVEVVASLGSEPKQAFTTAAPSYFTVHWQVGNYSYQWGWKPNSSHTAKMPHILK